MTDEQKIKAAEKYADNFGCRIHSREDYELVVEIYTDGYQNITKQFHNSGAVK